MNYKYNPNNFDGSNITFNKLSENILINKKGVIVFGGHVQGYGIIRIFGENKIPTILIDRSNKNIAKHSKYCHLFIESEDENIITLLTNLKKYSELKGWLLFPTDDYYVRILSINKERLNDFYRVTVDKWNTIEYFFNKRFSYPLAEKNSVPIPKTFYPDSIKDVEIISKKIEFPCIIKPSIMLDFYKYFKKKVFVCNSKSELINNYLKASEILTPQNILIQEIIPGNSENQYSVGIFFDRDKSYNLIVGRRKRQHPMDFGNATTFAETVNIPILIDYTEKILKSVNFWGICEVEFKYDSRVKQYKFLEVNPRTWKWHLLSEISNVPILMSLYNYMDVGIPISKIDYEQAGWRDLITDYLVIIKLLLKGQLLKSDKTKIIHAVINKKDIKPFIFQLIYLPYFFFKR